MKQVLVDIPVMQHPSDMTKIYHRLQRAFLRAMMSSKNLKIDSSEMRARLFRIASHAESLGWIEIIPTKQGDRRKLEDMMNARGYAMDYRTRNVTEALTLTEYQRHKREMRRRYVLCMFFIGVICGAAGLVFMLIVEELR